MPTPVILGADDQSVTIRILDSTTFLPVTTITSASAGLALVYRKGATGAVTSITESDLAAVDSAHSDGGMKHLDTGHYRVDLPDVAIPTIEGEVTIVSGAVTGGIILSAALVGVQPIGAPAGASIAADLAAIEAQTDDIGAAGAGLTAVPWNAAWDAEVQSEVADALAATDAITAATLSATAIAKIADAVLRRTAANIEASANGDTLSVESLYGVVMASFEAALSGTTLTVRKSDGTTLGTKTVTVDATADPITGIT